MADEKDNKKSPPRAPQAPSNLPVVNQLSEGNKVAVMQEKGINDLNAVMTNLFDATVQGTQVMIDHLGKILNIQESQFALQQEIQREAYERWLESQRAKDDKGAKPPTNAEGDPQDPSNLPLGFMTGLAIVLGALAAEMSGFDKAIRALQLPGIFKSAKETFGSIARFFGKEGALAKVVDNFGRGDDYLKLVDKLQTNIYRMFGLGIDGKPIVMRDLDTGLFRRASMFFENVGTVLDQQVKYMIGAIKDALKLPDLEFIASPIQSIKNLLNSVDVGLVEAFPELMASIKAGFTSFKAFIPTSFADVGKGLDTAFVGIKTFITDSGKFVGDIFDKLKPIFGSADEGTGIIGFFGKMFGFMRPLLKPFEFLLKTVMRPFTQILFTIIDFVTGFYDGFTQGEGGFMSKIASGIEGGILGVIKGITDAIDLLLIDIPAWFLEKLGFENVAKNLGEFSVTELFMDVYNSIKTFFKNLFSSADELETDTSFLDNFNMSKIIEGILQTLLPDPDGMLGGLILKTDTGKDLYTMAGIDPETGEKIQKQVEPTDTGSGAGGAAGAKTNQAGNESAMANVNAVDNSQVAVTTVNRAGDKQVTYVNKTWTQPMPLKTASVGMDY